MKHTEAFDRYITTREQFLKLRKERTEEAKSYAESLRLREQRLAELDASILKAARELVSLSNDIPKLLHADVSGMLPSSGAGPVSADGAAYAAAASDVAAATAE